MLHEVKDVPMSSAFSNSARPTSTLSSSSSGPRTGFSMERVSQALQAVRDQESTWWQRSSWNSWWQGGWNERSDSPQRSAAPSPQPSSPRAESPRGMREVEMRLNEAVGTPLPPETVPAIYEGNDTSCSICAEEFRDGDRVCRLACRHVFHTECWEKKILVDINARGIAPSHDCPNCRGPPTMIAIWLYIGTDRVTQEHQGLTARNEIEGNAQRFPLAQNDMSTPATPRSAEYELQRQTSPSSARELIAQAFSPRNSPRDSPRQIFPTFTGVFHSQTRLPDGRPSVIIDPGSVQNLCGDKWAKLVAMAAARAGAKPTHQKRVKPLDVSGVGNGSQACHFDCSLPVAFRSERITSHGEDEHTSRCEF